jgi:hypothetical protein
MMNDFERRLRDALRAASEQPPPGLMDAVMRRHKRHQFRLGASLVAVAAAVAVAVSPVTNALRSGSPGGPAGPRRPASSRVHPGRSLAAAGTVLSGCAAANSGSVGADWRSRPGTAHAGPLWFLDGGHSKGRLRLYVAVVVLQGQLKPGSVVVVKVAPAGQRYLRFLYGPADSLSSAATYTMRSGESGVTFQACAPMPPGITDYYGGFLIDGARCVPAQVWLPGRARPALIRLGACAGY